MRLKYSKAAPVRKPSEAPTQPQVFYLKSGVGVAVVKYTDYIAAEEGLRHPIVYRALDKLAGSVQQVHWLVKEDPNATDQERAKSRSKIADIQAVIDSPNDDMSAGQFRYWMALNYASYGRVPVKVGFSALKKDLPNALYPLEARLINAKQNEKGNVDSYVYGLGEAKQEFPSRTTYKKSRTSKGFVDQIWKTGLKGYQTGDDVTTPMRAIGLPAQVIRSLLLRAIQTAEGHPNVRYMVTCSKSLTTKQVDTLRAHLNSEHGIEGFDAGSVPVLQNAGDIEIHTVENDLSDIHSKMPSDDMARLIFGAFGIPIALAGIGAADAAKFAGNFDESRASFWEDTILPMYVKPLFGGLTTMLCPPGLHIVPDIDSIPAMKLRRIASMKDAKEINFLTTDEKRAMFGFDPTTDIPASPSSTGEPK